MAKQFTVIRGAVHRSGEVFRQGEAYQPTDRADEERLLALGVIKLAGAADAQQEPDPDAGSPDEPNPDAGSPDEPPADGSPKPTKGKKAKA